MLSTVYQSVTVEYLDGSRTYEVYVDVIVTSDSTLDATVYYILSFDTDGGSQIAPERVDYGYTPPIPANPTKENYTFGGWYEDSELTTEFDFDVLLGTDKTIYAKWIGGYTITIENQDALETCYVTATPANGDADETYTLAQNENVTLAKTVVPNETISTAYTTIEVRLGTDYVTNIDTSTVMDEDKEYIFTIPHPSLGTTIRLVNNSSTNSFSFVATPTDISVLPETGTVSAGSSASLNISIDTGEAVSTAYSSIVVTYPDMAPISADVSVEATSDTYLDLEFTDREISETVPIQGTTSYSVDNTPIITISNLTLVQYTDDLNNYDLQGDIWISAPDNDAQWDDLRTNGVTDAIVAIAFDSGTYVYDNKSLGNITTSVRRFTISNFITTQQETDIEGATLDSTFTCGTTITLDANGGEFFTSESIYTSPVNICWTLGEQLTALGVTIQMVTPTKQDNSFEGWTTDGGETIITAPENMKIYEPTTLTAVWEYVGE